MKISHPRLLVVTGLFLALYLAGCSKDNVNTSGLYVPGNADTTANATLQELQQGRVLYINNCSRCHSLYSPDDYGSGQWPQILAAMGPRAGLSSSQTSLVQKYLTRGK
jgi:hypothetical protein